MTRAVMASPPEGTAWRPGRSGNTVSWDGSAVVKRHAAGPAACLRELAVLARVADLPVARVLPGTRRDALRLGYVPGISVDDAVEAGLASSVLHALGEALRRVRNAEVRRFGAAEPGQVLVHGDLAPYNVIVSEDGTEVLAILDWEMAHLGDPLVDLAWCEWQFRRMFPRHLYALPHLFAGDGREPERAALEAALEGRLAELSAAKAVPVFTPPRYFALAFADRLEGAAYAASVSRAAFAPSVSGVDAPAEIWLATAPDGRTAVLLNETAALVSERTFRHGTRGETVAELPPTARLAFLAGHVGPLGREDVIRMA